VTTSACFGEVDFGKLKEGNYQIYIEANESGIDYPVIEYTRRFSIPKNNGGLLLALPEPLQWEEIIYDNEVPKSFAYVSWRSGECATFYDGNIYTSPVRSINPNEANLYFSGAFNDNSYPTIDIEDSTLYAIYESREERPDRTIISRSEVIELFKFGSENALLTLGEMTEFTSPEDETKKLFIEVEKDEYYMLDLYDNANSELSGEVLVLSSEPYSMKYELNQPKELARLSGV